MGAGTKGRLLVVDDDDELVRGWRKLLRATWEVVQAGSLWVARRRIAEAPVDVVLLDIKLPDGEGFDLLPELLAISPRPVIVAMSGSYEADHALRLLGHCDAFIPKPIPAPTLLEVVRRASSLDRRQAPHSPVEAFIVHHDLSGKEAELVRLAVDGCSNDEIAEGLGCRRTTLSTYWSRIFHKVGCHSQREVMSALYRFTIASSPARVSGVRTRIREVGSARSSGSSDD